MLNVTSKPGFVRREAISLRSGGGVMSASDAVYCGHPSLWPEVGAEEVGGTQEGGTGFNLADNWVRALLCRSTQKAQWARRGVVGCS